ncbi:EAL domain-containing protein [Deinococcus cavernae]|uniref:EAL domain-containing protein n=1 Tax=Deinococcus cavernae TaxID=2320857 RepID=UPI001F49083E|nr:EAL domain-containing protein [Deinococcus cavernae]
MSISAATDPVLHLALRDLLRAHAPHATLLATVGERVLSLRADAPVSVTPGSALVPPDEWLAGGDLAWLTRDGALLGLLWSPEAPVAPGAVEVLTLLLSAAGQEGSSREADMLITQLPAATAWLSADLTFRQVSRTFLELFGLTDQNVVGQALLSVLPDSLSLAQQLAGASSGRSVHLRDERLPGAEGRWVRGDAKPYFGGAAAGVLWTAYDVTPEYARAGELAALLDTDLPLALLAQSGEVRQISRGFEALTACAAEAALPGTPLWHWPCFTEEGQDTLKELVQAAQGGQPASTEVTLAGGGAVMLAARHSAFAPELLIVEGPARYTGSQVNGHMVSQVLSLSEAATIVLDHAGRAQLISAQAADLLEIDAAQVAGLALTRTLDQMGLKLYTPDGDLLPWPDFKALPLPYTLEAISVTVGGTRRHLEMRVTRMDAEAPGRKAGLLLTLRDQTALKRAHAKLQHDANHDQLTGLLNRVGLRQRLTRPEAAGGMVAAVDVDGFGALNAALGRTAGDLLLIQLAARLNDLASDNGGVAARLTDDAFALLLPGSAEVGIQKIQAALQEPLRAGKRLVPITFAIGTASLPPGAPDQALTDAEMALQHARRQGRGQVQLFNVGLRDEQARTFELENDLRYAIEQQPEQFNLLYQPAVSLKDGRAIGAEALLRWTHPTLGNISPARFLPIAERSDLIVLLGEWVLREAGRGRAIIRESLRKGEWRTSVNLSLAELRHPRAAERLLPLMTKLNALDVEVSAGSLLDHSQETLGVLERLRSKGSRLIVDDFGDAASSLTALTRFPLSGLKLHPTLTAKLPDDNPGMKLVQGTVSIAHSLGLSVTAVGVETYAQLDALRDLGVNAAQGYALTPPLGVHDLATWLKNR